MTNKRPEEKPLQRRSLSKLILLASICWSTVSLLRWHFNIDKHWCVLVVACTHSLSLADADAFFDLFLPYFFQWWACLITILRREMWSLALRFMTSDCDIDINGLSERSPLSFVNFIIRWMMKLLFEPYVIGSEQHEKTSNADFTASLARKNIRRFTRQQDTFRPRCFTTSWRRNEIPVDSLI